MFWKKKPYEKLMEAYPKEGYRAWKIQDSDSYSFGVSLKEHDEPVKIMRDGNKIIAITSKAAAELGLEAIVEGPLFLAGGVYGVYVGVKEKSA